MIEQEKEGNVSTVWRLGQHALVGGWRSAPRRWLCSVRVWLSVTFSMRSRHSALSIQSMASHWMPSLWGQRHTPTTYTVYKYKQLARHTRAVLSSVNMWWNEPCPSCWSFIQQNNCLGENLSRIQTSGSLPVKRRPNPHPLPYLSVGLSPAHAKPCFHFEWIYYTSIQTMIICINVILKVSSIYWAFFTCCIPAAPVRKCAY